MTDMKLSQTGHKFTILNHSIWIFPMPIQENSEKLFFLLLDENTHSTLSIMNRNGGMVLDVEGPFRLSQQILKHLWLQEAHYAPYTFENGGNGNARLVIEGNPMQVHGVIQVVVDGIDDFAAAAGLSWQPVSEAEISEALTAANRIAHAAIVPFSRDR